MSSHASIGERLAQEIGILAGRLVRFLELALARPESTADANRFLHTVYEAVADGQPIEAWRGSALDRRPPGTPHPLDRLAAALGLTPLEADLLLLAGMAEAHEGFAAVFRGLHPRGESRPSAGLAAQLFCPNPQDRLPFYHLLEDGRLVASGALRVAGEGSFYERSLHLAEKLWPVLHGLEIWPASIDRVHVRVASAGLDEWLAGREASRALAALAQAEPCTILVTAETEEVAFRRAVALSERGSHHCAPIALHGDLDADTERLIQLHTLARGLTPVFKLPVPDGPAVPEVPAMSGYPAGVVVCGRTGACRSHGGRPLIHVLAERLAPISRLRMWRETLPDLAPDAPHLAAHYPVEPSVAYEVAADLACIRKIEGRAPTVDEVGPVLRARVGLSLAGGVRLIRPTAAWDDLVLSEDRMAQLREAVNRLQWQSRVLDEWGFLQGRAGARGVRMLFSGPPGTGKTLSAEVLAGAMHTDLLFVDISRVVSKWIGETEKNLAAVFDCAERAQAVLFFDEADALFGKRTEVSDAHDRYANLETAFMLARLERFEGLSILATNLRQNIDPAFLRRIEFAVDFDEPDRAERAALWRCHIPKSAPLGADVDLGEFAARYPIVGGLIRNAAVAAGFLAASDGGIITRNHLLRALQREYQKAGRAFPANHAASPSS